MREFAESRPCECLGEDVREVVSGSAVVEFYLVGGNTLSYEMVANIDVLAASVKRVTVSKFDSALIVDVENRGVGLCESELLEKVAKPDDFARCMADSHVFGFHARERDCRLFLRVPSEDSTCEDEGVAGNRAAVVFVACPVGV